MGSVQFHLSVSEPKPLTIESSFPAAEPMRQVQRKDKGEGLLSIKYSYAISGFILSEEVVLSEQPIALHQNFLPFVRNDGVQCSGELYVTTQLICEK
jgi:hypothetical protein